MSNDEETAFETELDSARELLDDESNTAFYVGVVRDGETVETTFAQTADDPQQEGLQALSLLATHVRIVSNQAGVEPSVVAGDAATLAGQFEELSPEGLAAVGSDEEKADDE